MFRLRKRWDRHDGVTLHEHKIGMKIVVGGEGELPPDTLRITVRDLEFLSENLYLEEVPDEVEESSEELPSIDEAVEVHQHIETAEVKTTKDLNELSHLVADMDSQVEETPVIPEDKAESIAERAVAMHSVTDDNILQRDIQEKDNTPVEQDMSKIAEKISNPDVERLSEVHRNVEMGINDQETLADFENAIGDLNINEQNLAKAMFHMPKNEETMTNGGKPDANYLRDQLNRRVTAAERDKVWEVVQKFQAN